MFKRSDSSTSLSSSNTDPPENLEEDEIRYLESYQHTDIDEYDIEGYDIPTNPGLAYRTVRISFDQPRYKSPLEYYIARNKTPSQIPVLKEFVPDMNMLEKEFNSEQNRVRRETYRANHTKEQKIEVLEKWKLFMKEVKTDYPFFEYFEKHFKWKKENKTPSKDMPSKRVRCSTQKVEKPFFPSPETNVSKALKFDQESPSSPISHKVCQIHQDSSSPRIPDNTSSSPDEVSLPTDSCYKDNTIKVLPRQEELLLDLEKQIKEPERKSQSNFHKTIAQTTDPIARVSTPSSLERDENHTLQIQSQEQNPDLDFVQQLVNGTVRLSFDRSRLSTPLDYEYRQPLDISQSRSPINRLTFDRSRPSTPCGKPLETYQFGSPSQPINQPGNSSKPIQVLEKPLVKLPTTRHTSLSHTKDKTALEDRKSVV